MNSVKRIGINMISGAAGYVLPMLINVVSAPYVLAQLGNEAYGLLVLSNVIIGYLIVADMGLDIPVTQHIAEYYAKKDTLGLSNFLLATIKIYILIGLGGGILLITFTDPLLQLLDLPTSLHESAVQVFYMAALGFFGSIVNMWGKAVFNGLQRYEISNGINVIVNLASLIAGILLIEMGYGVVGFFGARVVGFAVSSIIYVKLAFQHLKKFAFKPLVDLSVWAELKKQVGYGFALRISGMVFSKLDQTFIGVWAGINLVASYSFSLLIAVTLSGIISSLTHFAFPMVASMGATRSKNDILAFFFKINKFINVISTLIFVPFIVYGDVVLELWISPQVAAENKIVIVMLLSTFYINTCLTTGLTSFVVGSGQLKYFTLYGLGRGVVLVIGFILLIKPFGLNGAGYSYAFSILLDVLYLVYTSKTRFQFDINRLLMNSYIKPIMIGIFLAIPMIFFKILVVKWIDLILVSAIFAGFYLMFIYVFRVLDKEERLIIVSFFRSKMKFYK